MASIYKNFVLLDGTEDMKPQSGMALIVVSGKIIKLCKEHEINLKGINSYDLGGRYLAPGFVNMHLHMHLSGNPKKAGIEDKIIQRIIQRKKILHSFGIEIAKKHAREEMMSGVTTLRAAAGVGYYDSDLKKLIEEGRTDGPRILAANTAIGMEGGHREGKMSRACGSVEEIRNMVSELSEGGSDFIKLMITRSFLDEASGYSGDSYEMPAEFIRAACDKAHELGLKVAALAETPEGMKAAVDNGVDFVEHGSFMDEDTATMFKVRGTGLVCSFTAPYCASLLDQMPGSESEGFKEKAKKVLEGSVSAAKTAISFGIKVGIGTDSGCPNCTHYGFWRELELFRKLVGVSPEFALYTGTLRNAEIAGLDKETGSIEEGKSADMVVYDKNPLDDFRNMASPYLVICRGEEFYKPKIRKNKEIEAMLDKYMQ